MRTRTLRTLAVGGAVALAVVLLPGGASGAATTTPHAALIDTNGRSMGSVTFAVVDGKMSVSATVTLPPQFAGFHGFHLHRVGKCETNAVDPATGARSPFFTASGHIGSEDGHSHSGHDGDLPVLLVNRDGTARMTVRTDHVSFARLFDSDGTAVVIHLLPDNFANIPARYSATGADAATLNTGDSGGRTVCGVVVR
ncbi:MAG TPA: superoxide dismutase family protein [Acidimicrobiales bacterium]|nr:superoxide dismutase family protein [Acidimicrobiales bacterium]